MSERKVAIVTGAGSGVGRAASIALAGAGYSLTLVSRTRETLEETRRLTLARAEGIPAVAIEILPADVADANACANVVQETLAKFGRIDALANVAGVAPICSISDTTPELWRQVIDVNLSSAIYLTTGVWRTFQKQKSGVIVNISSLASVDPFPGFALYAAAKVGLNMFTRVTAEEGASLGIKAVALALGAVETPMLRELFNEEAIPKSKTLSPTMVGEMIRDCITGAKKFERGQTILVPSP